MRTPKSSETTSVRATSITLFLFLLLALASSLALPSFAQEAEVNEANKTTKAPPRTVIKAFKYADVKDLKPLVEVVGVAVEVDPKRRLMVLRGPAGELDTALKLVEALDTPEPSWGVDLYVHVIEASMDGDGAAEMPQDLKAAFADLTELRGYGGYELVDTLFLHAAQGSGRSALNTAIGGRAKINIRFDQLRILYGEPKHMIRFEDLSIESVEAGIDLHTNVELPDGHKLLIGKSSSRGDDPDLILVIEARLKDAWPPGTGG